MKGGKAGSRMLSFALCAIVALLLLKLALTITGALREAPGVSVATPSAMAKEEKPGNRYAGMLQPKPAVAVSNAGSFPGGVSMNGLEQEESHILQQREQLRQEKVQLEKLKKDVAQKISTLLSLQKQTMLAQGEQKSAQKAKVQGLARIYGTMKPKQAAKLMGSLDDSLVKSIISTMPPDKAASILALMDVKKAAQISEALSGQN